MSQKAATPDPEEIAGRYQVVKRLGAGAFGTVYKAKDKVLGRMLAIKTIRLEGLAASGASIEELMDRFKREAQISAQLRHPNIVTIYDVGESDGMSYLAMEFIDGVGLERVIATAGRLPLERAALIAAQVADALDFAHQHSVVHRDIKPANIMIEAGDRVKVTDFGIAKVTDSAEHLTMTGSLLGTPSYMSPEQAKGGKLDGRSDLFAVGAILYEMLAGQKAFRGDSITGLIFKIITEEPQLISELDPTLPADLVRVVQKSLNKASELRYQTGRELAEDLLVFTRAGAQPTMRQGEIDTLRGGAAGAASPTLGGVASTMSESPTQHRAPATQIGRPPTQSGGPGSSDPTRLVSSGSVAPPAVDPTYLVGSGSRPSPSPQQVYTPPPAFTPSPAPPPAHVASGARPMPPVPGTAMPPAAVRSARIAPPEKSKAGMVIGLIGVALLLLLALGGGGLYWFVLRKPAPPTTLTTDTSVPTPAPAPTSTPVTSVTTPATLAASGTETTGTTGTAGTTTGTTGSTGTTTGAGTTTVTPATVPSSGQTGGTRVADGGGATSGNGGTVVPIEPRNGRSTGGGDLSGLDVEPPELNGRETGAGVADTYRNKGGYGNGGGSFGASGRLQRRTKVPRDLSMPERRAAVVMLNLMGLEAVHLRTSGRYGTLREILPAYGGAPGEIDRAGYRFQLKVESDGYSITATSGAGRALIADDSGFVRYADE